VKMQIISSTLTPKKNLDITTIVAANVNSDACDLHGSSYCPWACLSCNILHDYLGLVKKSAPRVPMGLQASEQGPEIGASQDLHGLCGYTYPQCWTTSRWWTRRWCPTTHVKPKQWIKKGLPGPVKAKVHASCTKCMVLALFDSRDWCTCTRTSPLGHHYPHQPHPGDPGQVHEASQEDEAWDSGGRLVFPCPHSLPLQQFRCFCTPSIRLASCRRTSSCSGMWSRSSLASTCPRRALECLWRGRADHC
jgi:hypothetical protein